MGVGKTLNAKRPTSNSQVRVSTPQFDVQRSVFGVCLLGNPEPTGLEPAMRKPRFVLSTTKLFETRSATSAWLFDHALRGAWREREAT